jgi:hypothetical protein
MRVVLISISCISGFLLTYGAFLFAPNFVHIVDFSLDRFFSIRFGYWSLQHIVFALSVGLVPIFSLVPWIIRGHRSIRSLFMYNVVASAMIILFTIVVAIILITFGPKGVFNTIKQPSVGFWNYVLIASDFFSFLFLLVFSLKTAKKNRLVNEFRDSMTELDQQNSTI